MKKHGWMMMLLVVLVGLLLVYSVTYAISFRQIGIVSTFGKAGEPVRGSDGDQAGLRAKLPWPIQRLQRYDARIQIFDDTHEQLATSDQQNVMVTIFCGWRIADAAKFYRKVTTMARAEELLRGIVRVKKGDVIGKTPLSALLNTDPEKMRILEIEGEIRDLVRAEAIDEYGFEVVTLGIKSLGLPPGDVTKEVIKTMQSERKEFADAQRFQGQAHAAAITARAQAASDQILAFADARARSIRSEGDRVVAEMYASYRKDEQLAIFLAELEFLRKVMDNTTIVGDAWLQHAFGMFGKGPSLRPLDSSAKAEAKKN